MSGESPPQRPIIRPADVEPPQWQGVDVELAHQLNTLLDGALRCVDQAQQALAGETHDDDKPAAPQIDRARNRIELAGQSMRRMVAYLEQAMTNDSGSDAHAPLPINASASSAPTTLAAAVEEACRWLTPLTEPLGITIETHLGPEAAELPAGPLETVLFNALRNAVDACARSGTEPGSIELVANCRKDILRMVITDTGTGLGSLDPDNASAQDAAEQHGHGLGLQICRRIARELDGEVRLMNIPFGRGAVFHVQIPINRLRAA